MASLLYIYNKLHGNIKSHYISNKPLYILGEHSKELDTKNVVFLSFGKIPDSEFKLIEHI